MSETIRVMSSNIWGHHPIADRDDKLAVIYHRYLPDVIGLQECSPKSRGEELSLLMLNADLYDEVPIEPTNALRNNYTPILYRRDRLTLVDYGWHYYSGLNDKGSKSLTWAVFDTADGGRFMHLNTHFFWTGDDSGRATRICNAGELLGLYWSLCKKYPCPAFFSGDFNCRSYEPPIKTLVQYGFREARYEAEEKSPYRSHHAYPTYHEDGDYFDTGVMPEERPEESIDHIFVVGEGAIKKFVTVVDSESLDSSDHCPIFCDIEL